MLTLSHISKAYGSGEGRREILRDIDLTVEPGQIISIIGKSGSGKSTLLNIITGMLRPSQGVVTFEGTPVQRKEFVKLRGREIGYVWQGQSLLHSLTVLENVCLPHYLAGKKEDISAQAKAVLEELELSHLAGAYPGQLSGGEAKRVAVARALLHAPKLLVADEPTSNLDGENSEKIWNIFEQAKQRGVAVLCSTHDRSFLGRSDRIYEMEDGALSLWGGEEVQ